LVLAGTVAPMRKGDETSAFPGRVWLGDDGSVMAVTAQGQADPPGVVAPTVVEAGDAVIYPGLVDLHSHLGYNSLPLWADAARASPYLHHDSWPGQDGYPEEVSWPAWILLDRAPECMLAYVQVRALAGGTTSIQGWPNVSRAPMNALVRCVDDDQVGPLSDPVMVSALTQTPAQLTDRASNMAKGRVFVYHCAEGQPGSIVAREFEDLAATGCLQRGLAAIHCSALDRSHFLRWKRAAHVPRGAVGTVVWSPFSNLWLYGVTTDVPAARSNRLAVSLGSDWGPSGTKNLLGEIKVARIWSDRQGWSLTDHDLALMVTASPGDILGRAWGRPVGRLVEGGAGDAVVIARRTADPWKNLVSAREADVMLVVVAGRARYGTPELMRAAGERTTAAVRIGPAWRRVTLVRPEATDQAWSWTEVRSRLEAVRAAAAAVPPSGPSGTGRRRAIPPPFAGDPPGTPPIVARPDMPAVPAQVAGPPPKGVTVKIPPIEPIHHSRDWLLTIERRGFHGGVLDGLAGFYR
jgi:cytosine/adenosine deaminase-related metal-dependent hydrolase